MYDNIPDINNKRKDEQMKDLDKNLKELVTSAKISALYEIKRKVQEEIDELERKEWNDDEIPF